MANEQEPPSRCAEYRLIMSKGWDEEATPTELRLLEEHLRVCSGCRDSTRRMRSFLTAMERVIDELSTEDTPRP